MGMTFCVRGQRGLVGGGIILRKVDGVMMWTA